MQHEKWRKPNKNKRSDGYGDQVNASEENKKQRRHSVDPASSSQQGQILVITIQNTDSAVDADEDEDGLVDLLWTSCCIMETYSFSIFAAANNMLAWDFWVRNTVICFGLDDASFIFLIFWFCNHCIIVRALKELHHFTLNLLYNKLFSFT